MGIEELRREILEEAERKVNEILSEARAEADKIIRDAEEKARMIRLSREQEVRKRMEERLRSELSLARIEGKKLIVNTKWEVVDQVFKAAWERFTGFRGSKEYYGDFLPRMIALGVNKIGVDEVLIHVNKEDATRLKGLLGKLSKDVSKLVGRNIKIGLANDYLDIVGGVVVSDVEEKVYFNASFEALFNRAREELAVSIFELLFGGG